MSGEHFAHVRLSLVTRCVMHLPHPTFESAAYPSMRVDAFLSEGTRTNAPIFKPSRRASPRPELTDARPPARGRHRFFATFALPATEAVQNGTDPHSFGGLSFRRLDDA
jgi:hypothetical protein